MFFASTSTKLNLSLFFVLNFSDIKKNFLLDFLGDGVSYFRRFCLVLSNAWRDNKKYSMSPILSFIIHIGFNIS